MFSLVEGTGVRKGIFDYFDLLYLLEGSIKKFGSVALGHLFCEDIVLRKYKS